MVFHIITPIPMGYISLHKNFAVSDDLSRVWLMSGVIKRQNDDIVKWTLHLSFLVPLLLHMGCMRAAESTNVLYKDSKQPYVSVSPKYFFT